MSLQSCFLLLPAARPVDGLRPRRHGQRGRAPRHHAGKQYVNHMKPGFGKVHFIYETVRRSPLFQLVEEDSESEAKKREESLADLYRQAQNRKDHILKR